MNIIQLNKTSWQKATIQFLDHNYRQLWDYTILSAQKTGAEVEHLAITDGTATLGLAAVRTKRLGIGRGGLAYITGGPLVRRGESDDDDRLRRSLRALTDEFINHRGMILRVNPPPGEEDWNHRLAQQFSEHGFLKSRGKGYRTFLVNVEPQLDILRKGLVHQWRTNLNHALKASLDVEFTETEDGFRTFKDLYGQMLERKNFQVAQGPEFYEKVQQSLNPPHRLEVAIARYENSPVGGFVISILGDTAHAILAATNKQGLATRASYRLQWAIIERIRSRGVRWYDLGGIDPGANPGGYQFKKGMGGIDVTAPGPYEKYPAGIVTPIILGGEWLYRRLRKLKTYSTHLPNNVIISSLGAG